MFNIIIMNAITVLLQYEFEELDEPIIQLYASYFVYDIQDIYIMEYFMFCELMSQHETE